MFFVFGFYVYKYTKYLCHFVCQSVCMSLSLSFFMWQSLTLSAFVYQHFTNYKTLTHQLTQHNTTLPSKILKEQLSQRQQKQQL